MGKKWFSYGFNEWLLSVGSLQLKKKKVQVIKVTAQTSTTAAGIQGELN